VPVSVALLRKHALSLPGASEARHFERTSFRIGTKIFATVTKDGTEAMVRVKPMAKLKQRRARELAPRVRV
jgi:predicted DNA-binding protein (MmcQ/YjbR family)